MSRRDQIVSLSHQLDVERRSRLLGEERAGNLLARAQAAEEDADRMRLECRDRADQLMMAEAIGNEAAADRERLKTELMDVERIAHERIAELSGENQRLRGELSALREFVKPMRDVLVGILTGEGWRGPALSEPPTKRNQSLRDRVRGG